MIALPGAALLKLTIRSTILPAIIYGGIAALYLSVRKRMERTEGGFSLGRLELPIAIAALVWLPIVLFVLVTPADVVVPNLIVVGMVYFTT